MSIMSILPLLSQSSTIFGKKGCASIDVIEAKVTTWLNYLVNYVTTAF